MLTCLLPSHTTAQLSQGTMKEQMQPQSINIKVYLYKSLFSFLVLRLQTPSCSGCSYCLFGLKNPTMVTLPCNKSQHTWENKDKVEKKKNMARAQGSPLLNCTWREIPLNSSWQRQWAGRQIKQSLSRSPINTSHSLASLQTPSPQPSLYAPPANHRAELHSTCFRGGHSSHLKRNILLCFTSPAALPLVPLC